MDKNADVIVIGSGIVGCAAAYYMVQKGLKVLVLERGNIGDGASSRNGAGVRLSGREEREFRFAKDAIFNIWPTLSEELGADLEYSRVGSLSLAQNESQMQSLKKEIARAQKQGIEMRQLSGDEARKLCPYLSEEVNLANYCPINGVANPMTATLAYYRKARNMGVHFITGEEAVEIQKDRGRARKVVTKSGNVYEAQKIILAAGFESRVIVNTVGIDFPMLKRIDECIITEVQPKMFPYRLSTADGNFYGHQTAHGSFIFGGNTGMERYVNTYTENPRCTTMAAADKSRAVMKYIPALKDAKIVRQWAGWLDSTIDRLPVIQEIPEIPDLICAFGFSGHGFAIGPSVGRVLSEMAAGETPSVDISGLNYDRFKALGC